jgi:hypothetical protein
MSTKLAPSQNEEQQVSEIPVDKDHHHDTATNREKIFITEEDEVGGESSVMSSTAEAENNKDDAADGGAGSCLRGVDDKEEDKVGDIEEEGRLNLVIIN